MKKQISLITLALLLGASFIKAQTPAKKTTATPANTSKTSTPAKAAATTYKDERDGEVYKTAVIDGKTWMTEPFRHKPDNCDCIYWEESDKSKGAFYTVAQAKAVIPEGWRIPTSEEYTALLEKLGSTPEALTKAGFPVELLRFNLDTYQNIKKYKNDEFMLSTLVGNKKAFYYDEYTFFLAQQITKNKLDSGYEYESVNNTSLQVTKDTVKVMTSVIGDYLRLFLIKA